MSGLSIQGSYTTNSLYGAGDTGPANTQDIEQLLSELLQAIRQMLAQGGGDPDDGGSPPVRTASPGPGGDGAAPFDGDVSGATGAGPGMAPAAASSTRLNNTSGNAASNIGANSKLGQWGSDINTAANLTRIDPNVIGAQMWAESRGDNGPDQNSTNMDGTTDRGLMQISNERWRNDVLPTLSDADKSAIVKATGKQPDQLDMSDPSDNVIGGAFELRSHIVDAGGDADNPMANSHAVLQGLAAYRGVGDGQDDQYAQQVVGDANNLHKGRQLNDAEAL
jgi:hypothetical protein